jgi:methionine-rich copper-binding protein CopC
VNRQHLYHSVFAGALFLFAMLIISTPGTAKGHAFPDHSDPRVGSTVSASPSRISIWFDSGLEPVFSSIMVHAEKDDSMVDKRDGRVDPSDPTLLEVSVPPLPPGVYIVYWSVVARDGHRTSGKYTFAIQAHP